MAIIGWPSGGHGVAVACLKFWSSESLFFSRKLAHAYLQLDTSTAQTYTFQQFISGRDGNLTSPAKCRTVKSSSSLGLRRGTSSDACLACASYIDEQNFVSVA